MRSIVRRECWLQEDWRSESNLRSGPSQPEPTSECKSIRNSPACQKDKKGRRLSTQWVLA